MTCQYITRAAPFAMVMDEAAVDRHYYKTVRWGYIVGDECRDVGLGHAIGTAAQPLEMVVVAGIDRSSI